MKIVRENGSFKSFDGFRLHEQSWAPEKESDIKAILIVVHGYGEHSGRYDHVGTFFAENGFYVAAFDHRGHGQSDGKDTILRSIDDCAEDVEVFLERIRTRVPGTPGFILAHSMGGLIVTDFVLRKQPQLNGILLSGASVKISDEISPFLVKIAGVLGKIAPNMKTIKLDGNSVSRDPNEIEKYNNDPLNYRGGVPAATGAAMNNAISYIDTHAEDFSLPVRIMFGTDDKMADPAGSRNLYETISSKDKTLVPYEGLYHEILNEPEKQQIMEECLAWMTDRY